MAKKTIHTQLDVESWIDGLDGKTIREAIEYLSQYDYDVVMDQAQDYDYSMGYLYTERLETDEEEQAREIAEAEKLEKRIKQDRDAKEYSEQKQAERLQSKLALDIALYAYLEKHKNNPRKEDLGNLFLALVNLEKDGHNSSGAAMRQIKECMDNLEGQW